MAITITEKDVYGQSIDIHTTFIVTGYNGKKVNWRIQIKRTPVNYGSLPDWVFMRGTPAALITTLKSNSI